MRLWLWHVHVTMYHTLVNFFNLLQLRWPGKFCHWPVNNRYVWTLDHANNKLISTSVVLFHSANIHTHRHTLVYTWFVMIINIYNSGKKTCGCYLLGNPQNLSSKHFNKPESHFRISLVLSYSTILVYWVVQNIVTQEYKNLVNLVFIRNLHGYAFLK